MMLSFGVFISVAEEGLGILATCICNLRTILIQPDANTKR